MVRCKACSQHFHQVCVMHNPFLAREDEFECGSDKCTSICAPVCVHLFFFAQFFSRNDSFIFGLLL